MSQKIMDKGWFDCFTNQNLRLAFHYRMIGDYKKAKVHLKLAAEQDDDGLAWCVLGDVHTHGGFGIKQDDSRTTECFSRSYTRGCVLGGTYLPNGYGRPKICWDVFQSQDVFVWANASLSIFNCGLGNDIIDALKPLAKTNPLINSFICTQILMDTDNVFVKRGLELGDGRVQAMCYNNITEMLKAAQQRVTNAIDHVCKYFFYNLEYEKCLYYGLKGPRTNFYVDSILRFCPGNKLFMYMFGKSRHGGSMKHIYTNVTTNCRSSVLCFIWCAYKKSKVLSKDIATLIGKMVYRSRSKDIELWDTATVLNKTIKKK